MISVDLYASRGRWPQFAPIALATGFKSVHAFPLRLREQVIGTLNLLSDRTGDMSTDDAQIVQALADITTIGLLQERAIRDQEVITVQLQAALNSRVVIEQAKGALATIHLCTPDEAFILLRNWCRSHRTPLREAAYGVTNHPSRYPELTTPRIR